MARQRKVISNKPLPTAINKVVRHCEHEIDVDCKCSVKLTQNERDREVFITLYNILLTNDNKPVKKEDDNEANKAARLKSINNIYAPKMIRPYPGITYFDNEMQCFNPQTLSNKNSTPVVLDYSMCSNPKYDDTINDLIDIACKETLTAAQEVEINFYLEHEKLFSKICIDPDKVPLLVENNPLLTVDVLSKILSSGDIGVYLAALGGMKMSLHSMEVVNRLTYAVKLPKTFLYTYISNCITSCDKVKDIPYQGRLVRLICVFLQSLIRNELIDIKEISNTVQSFCVNYSKIREAAGLFRLLRKMEPEIDEKDESDEKKDTSVKHKN